MPHIPGHFQTRDRSNNISNSPNYRIYGTNQPYSGMTVEIGGHLYTTKGGALEGNSYQLVAAQQMTPDGFANPDLGNLDPLVRRPMTPEGTEPRRVPPPSWPCLSLGLDVNTSCSLPSISC